MDDAYDEIRMFVTKTWKQYFMVSLHFSFYWTKYLFVSMQVVNLQLKCHSELGILAMKFESFPQHDYVALLSIIRFKFRPWPNKLKEVPLFFSDNLVNYRNGYCTFIMHAYYCMINLYVRSVFQTWLWSNTIQSSHSSNVWRITSAYGWSGCRYTSFCARLVTSFLPLCKWYAFM